MRFPPRTSAFGPYFSGLLPFSEVLIVFVELKLYANSGCASIDRKIAAKKLKEKELRVACLILQSPW